MLKTAGSRLGGALSLYGLKAARNGPLAPPTGRAPVARLVARHGRAPRRLARRCEHPGPPELRRFPVC